MRAYIDRVGKVAMALAFLLAVLMASNKYPVGDAQALVTMIMAMFLLGAGLYFLSTPISRD